MPAEATSEVVHQFEEAMRRKDAAFMDAHPGLHAHKAFFHQLWAAFPDLRGTPETVVVADEWITQRTSVSGTMQGTLLGMAPTGRHGSWEVITMFRIADGKIVE